MITLDKQAQFAVGALWRSKKAVIVGDPIQIEPVVMIDKNIVIGICKHFNLEENYMSITTSVQRVADLANPYKFTRNILMPVTLIAH